MKKLFWLVTFTSIVLTGAVGYLAYATDGGQASKGGQEPVQAEVLLPQTLPVQSLPVAVDVVPQPRPAVSEVSLARDTILLDAPDFVAPMDSAVARVTKKEFGTKIVPGHSPVPNDKFAGYHTAVDFEILDDSENLTEVAVRAVCAGPLRLNQWSRGYGGLAVQECILDGKPLTVVYGHMDTESIKIKVGQRMIPGQLLGNLGDAYSHETDGVRKHLHLGFYNNAPTDFRGYVPQQKDLARWIDPCPYVCK